MHFDNVVIPNYHSAYFRSQKDKKRPTTPNDETHLIFGSVTLMIGPYFLHEYINERRKYVWVALEIWQKMLYPHDDYPAPYRINVPDLLDNQYAKRWIVRRRSFPLPAKSPDLTSMDLYVWGFMKSLVIINAAEHVKTFLEL